jgi:HTH-type transcriptional regulator, competence development regulator
MQTLGEALRKARLGYGWSLREAERQTGIHNAHLSQIESGTIAKPDPNILFTLAQAYQLKYDTLLRLAGHIQAGGNRGRPSPYGAVAWKALSELDEDEQREVVEYIANLRGRTTEAPPDE